MKSSMYRTDAGPAAPHRAAARRLGHTGCHRGHAAATAQTVQDLARWRGACGCVEAGCGVRGVWVRRGAGAGVGTGLSVLICGTYVPAARFFNGEVWW